jgi:hypothetical protein
MIDCVPLKLIICIQGWLSDKTIFWKLMRTDETAIGTRLSIQPAKLLSIDWASVLGTSNYGYQWDSEKSNVQLLQDKFKLEWHKYNYEDCLSLVRGKTIKRAHWIIHSYSDLDMVLYHVTRIKIWMTSSTAMER